jgi:hypothetical protein
VSVSGMCGGDERRSYDGANVNEGCGVNNVLCGCKAVQVVKIVGDIVIKNEIYSLENRIKKARWWLATESRRTSRGPCGGVMAAVTQKGNRLCCMTREDTSCHPINVRENNP